MTRLSLKAEPPTRLALDGLLPERLAGLSTAEIERLPLLVGNRREAVGDWFNVEPGDPARLEIAGDCGRLDRIGAGMSSGGISVSGNAGAYLGIGMSGGTLSVSGAVGFGAATDLRGGTVQIGADAGDGLGGSLPGATGGMRGGTVIVAGNAGAQPGHRLRRGLIVVSGNAGPGCGAEMIAGTIVLGGSTGILAGAAMRRGSIIALGGTARIAPTFGDSGVHELLILKLLAQHLARIGLGALAARLGPLRRWLGDAAVAGRGELLVTP